MSVHCCDFIWAITHTCSHPQSQTGITALYAASIGPHVEVLNALAAAGADINAKTNVGGGTTGLSGVAH